MSQMESSHFFDFIQNVEQRLSSMTQDQIQAFILEQARTSPVALRSDFLEKLDAWAETKPLDAQGQADGQSAIDPEAAHSALLYLQNLAEGEGNFRCSWEEVYYENHWDPDDIVCYQDPESIGVELMRICALAESLMDHAYYSEAFSLFEALFALQVDAIDEDACDNQELDFKLLIDEGLLSCDFKQMATEALYTCYQSSSPETRAAKIFRCYQWKDFPRVDIELIFTVGKKKAEQGTVFLENWLELLKQEKSGEARDLLCDYAQKHMNEQERIKIALESMAIHPSLLEAVNEKLLNDKQYAQVRTFALKALEEIPVNWRIRATLADQGARAASQINERSTAERFMMEAFRSRLSPADFLRLFSCFPSAAYPDAAADYVKDLLPYQSSPARNQLFPTHDQGLHHGHPSFNQDHHERHLGSDFMYFQAFFQRDFAKLQKLFIKNVYLGWTNHPNGRIIELMLLMLNRDQLNGKGCQIILQNIKQRSGWTWPEESFSFMRYYLNWRGQFELSENEFKSYSDWLDQHLEKRAKAVMDEKHRGAYGRVAVLIAALGEALQNHSPHQASSGMKAMLMAKYHKNFTRFSAFRHELNNMM